MQYIIYRVLLLFSSCSQKHFSFRKTTQVKDQKQKDWVLIGWYTVGLVFALILSYYK